MRLQPYQPVRNGPTVPTRHYATASFVRASLLGSTLATAQAADVIAPTQILPLCRAPG